MEKKRKAEDKRKRRVERKAAAAAVSSEPTDQEVLGENAVEGDQAQNDP